LNIALFGQLIDFFTEKAMLLNNPYDVDEALKNIYLLSHVIYPYTDAFLVKTHVYMEKYREYRQYYDKIRSTMLDVSRVLERRLREEIVFLKAQGIESIISRITYLLAVLNCDEKLYYRYLDPLKIQKIMSVPPTPWAQHSKIFDFITGDTQIDLIPGGTIQLWVLKILVEELVDREITPRIHVPSKQITDHIDYDTLRITLTKKDMIKITSYNPERIRELITSLGEKGEPVLVSSPLGLAAITTLLYKENKTYDNIYLLFNPMETKLAKYLTPTPHIIPTTNITETIRIKKEK